MLDQKNYSSLEPKMKKMFATLMIATMLISSTANAGILILTGDIGNKFSGYKVVGWLTILFTGGTIVGLVVDADADTNSNVKMPALSEASLSMIENATANAAAESVSASSSIVTTISASLAEQIVALEGLDGSAEGALLYSTLTTK